MIKYVINIKSFMIDGFWNMVFWGFTFNNFRNSFFYVDVAV